MSMIPKKFKNLIIYGPPLSNKYIYAQIIDDQDGKTLYFCSNGLVGLGKSDLFFTKYNDSTGWQTPVNLGYPINTKGKEMSLVVTADGLLNNAENDRRLAGPGKK